ncbi:hypothetical protein Moror_13898 [Moniliophthora roreri MCA 2997]|uniref:DUF7918 domain-containing protein n=1 Tax=Moniliophthora roreri (strain MCA 2997) TaxID=1381753 RepID=V2XMS9_MONRO|nr:hypothetical protein Moror_13898 [Moniliophthora roreri MCA 2997]
MLHFKEFSAWVTIDGAPAEELGVEVSKDSNTVTCWIQSEEGKAFEINANDNKRTTATTIDFYVDGKKIPYGKVLHPQSRNKTPCKKKGFRISPELVKRFEFGRLNITDDDDAVTGSASQEVGEIKVTVVRTRVVCRKPAGGRERIPELPPEAVFHEKSKKGVLGAHQTSKDYGAIVAIFRFRYRPLSVLQAHGIIQPPPSLKRPGPSTSQAEPGDAIEISDDDDSDELERLRARVKELEAQRPQKKVKREPKVKAEIRHEAIKAFIDLT